MFCSSCGGELLSSHFYCPTCGTKVPDKDTTENTHEKSKPKVQLSFKDFQNRKSSERAMHFRPTKRKERRTDDQNALVKVSVGIMLFDGQVLKRQRGSSLDVTVKKMASAEELLKAALFKHKAHSKNLINPNGNYALLYSDGTKVEKLKETEEEFILHKYKAECGKQYHRISFFLCQERDFTEATLANLEKCLDDNTSSDDLNISADEREPKIIKIQNKDDAVTVTSEAIASLAGNSAISGRSATCIDEDENSRAGTSTFFDKYESHLRNLSEMFPQLEECSIRQTLRDTNYDIETAISIILSARVEETTSQEVYASLDFCRNIDSDDDFRDLETISNWNTTWETQKSEDSDNITSNEPIATAIKNLAAEKLKKEQFLRIKVRRSNVWENAKFKMKKCSDDDLMSFVKVQFVGEPAVDEGGPRNEFFSLLHNEMCKSGHFVGEQNRKCFNHDILALEQRNFFLYGQLCCLGIMLGSPSPCFFAPAIVDYIVYGRLDKVETSIKDVPDLKVRQKLQDLDEVEDPEEFKRAASFECPFRFKAGFSKPTITIQEKSKLLHAVALHHTLLSSLSEINQFVDGLKLHGFLDCIRQHPLEARKLFLNCENQLTAEKLDNLFVPIFSPRGNNKRSAEEAISLNFSRYLEEVESGEVTCRLVDFSTDEDTEMRITLGTVLQFITGSYSIPAVGFEEQPSITFLHMASGRKMTANTCSNTICLPVHSTFTDYETFKLEFTSCIAESPGFGNV